MNEINKGGRKMHVLYVIYPYDMDIQEHEMIVAEMSSFKHI